MAVILKKELKKDKDYSDYFCFVYDNSTGQIIKGEIKDNVAIVEVPHFSPFKPSNIRIKNNKEKVKRKKTDYIKDGEKVTVEEDIDREKLLKKAHELGIPASKHWKTETIQKHINKKEKEAFTAVDVEVSE